MLSCSERNGHSSESTPPAKEDSSVGTAYIFSFPFWLFVDTSSCLSIVEKEVDGQKIRIYPPFRCGAANFIPMPHVDIEKVPFLEGVKSEQKRWKILHAVAYPLLEVDQIGKTAMFVTDQQEWKDLINPFPMDCLRLDVFPADQDDFATEIVKRLLDLIRWRTKQWWISHSVDAILGYRRGEFLISKSGAILQEPSTGGRMTTVLGDELALDGELWRLVAKNLGDKVEPPSYDLLLLDARYFSNIGDIKRSVLDLAMACEQAFELTVQRIWRSRVPDKSSKLRQVLQGNDLANKLHRQLKNFTGRSYLEEEPERFSIIRNLWLTRNNVAHGSFAQYIDNGNIVMVDKDKVKGFHKTSEHCVRWLENLHGHDPANGGIFLKRGRV